METQKTNAKKAAQRDVHTITNDKIIEYLKKGIVPWRMQWTKGGLPTSLITWNPFRGINLILLSALGYERNLFLTEKHLETIGGAIKAKERPHMLTYWNNPKKDAEGAPTDDRKESKLLYYLVYNVAQCVGITLEMLGEVETYPMAVRDEIVDRMPHKPAIKSKETTAFYDPIEDIVNMPKKSSYKNDADYVSQLLHQLVHSTGHHTRLDRMGLVQMPEFGCQPFTLEELVAEIATSYLQSYVGIPADFTPSPEYLQGWIDALSTDKYLIFNASSLAQKALNFILNIPDAVDAELMPDAVVENAAA